MSIWIKTSRSRKRIVWVAHPEAVLGVGHPFRISLDLLISTSSVPSVSSVVIIQKRRFELMPMISLRQVCDHPAENNYGLPAFNSNNMNQTPPITKPPQEPNS